MEIAKDISALANAAGGVLLLGVTLGIVLILRLGWRISRGGMLPPLHQGLLLAIARATHWLLYALLLVTVGLGVTNVWVRGDSIFNLVKVAQLVPGDRALVHRIGDWHALAANAVLIVAGLHSAAALFHHLVLRDATSAVYAAHSGATALVPPMTPSLPSTRIV